MPIPTSGTYSGLSVYETISILNRGGAFADAVNALQAAGGFATLSIIPQTIDDPVALNATLTFSPDEHTSYNTDIAVADPNGASFTIPNTETLVEGSSVAEIQEIPFGDTLENAFYLSNAPINETTFDQSLASAASTYASDGQPAVSAAYLNLMAVADSPQYNLGSALGAFPAELFNGQPYAPPCFVSGTLIGTPNGGCAVEDLRAGDLVTLHDGTPAPVIWVGHRRQQDGFVIRIRRHALSHCIPARDLLVSSDHAILIGGLLVPAGLLVNGETIGEEQVDDVTFWHVELERHAILVAEGAPAETYLDTGNRRQFANCAFAYDPAHAVEDPCAELVLAGQRLEQIRLSMCSRVPV